MPPATWPCVTTRPCERFVRPFPVVERMVFVMLSWQVFGIGAAGVLRSRRRCARRGLIRPRVAAHSRYPSVLRDLPLRPRADRNAQRQADQCLPHGLTPLIDSASLVNEGVRTISR